METMDGKSFLLILDVRGLYAGLANAIILSKGNGFYAMETTNVPGTAKEIIEKTFSLENKVSFSEFVWSYDHEDDKLKKIESLVALNNKEEILFSWDNVRFFF